MLNFFSKEDPASRNFKKELADFKGLNTQDRFSNQEIDLNLYPCLYDNTGNTPFDAHYIYHPAWAARILKSYNPALHVDISSTLAFSTVISAFIKTEFYDYRPAHLNLDNITSGHANLIELPFESNSLPSLSCMHTLEHVGLGRYGDPLDPDGDLKAFAELKRVCAVNGNLLIVVPVGERKLQFNAHRIYNPFDIVSYMDGFELKQFALIDDMGGFIPSAELDNAAAQKYGCGCYWFVKNESPVK